MLNLSGPVFVFEYLNKSVFSKKVLIFLLLSIVGVIISCFAPIEILLRFVHDDSFFYIKTANNFSLGLGSTFDRINYTNGYHPLWFLILAVFYFLSHLFAGDIDVEQIFRLTIFIEYFLCLSISFISLSILRFLHSGKDLTKHASLLLVLNFIYIFTIDIGMESHVSILLVTFYLLLIIKELKFRGAYTLIKSLLLGLLALSRTEYLFTFVPVLIFADIFVNRNFRLKYVLQLFLFSVIFSSGYYFLNYISFGHLFTISSNIKSSFPRLILYDNVSSIISLLHRGLALKLFLAVITAIVFLFFLRRNSNKSIEYKFDLFLFGVFLASMSTLVMHLAFNEENLRPWYTCLSMFLIAFMLTRMIDRFYKPIVIGIVTIYFIYGILEPRSNQQSAYDYALELKKTTLPSDRIFQIDASGLIGFFSERSIINGDGLINSFEYWDYLKTNKLNEYFLLKNIKYYSAYSQSKSNSQMIYLTHPYYNMGGYDFSVFRANQLVYKSPKTTYFKVGDMNWYLFKIN